MYSIIQDKSVDKFLEKIPDKDYLRIANKLLELAKDPYSRLLDIKPMSGIEGLFRLRVGDYRIKYRIENQIMVIFVVDAGHRKDVYR